MKITKYGHACLLLEEEGAKILLDPGAYNQTPSISDLDAILISHEHQDHFQISQIQELVANNPSVQIITNQSVAKLLESAGIEYSVLAHGESTTVRGVAVSSRGKKHSFIYGELPDCENSGFLIAEKFYYPGDSFFIPEEKVEILALPVAGPWMKLGECIVFAKAISPKKVIPVHDGFFLPERGGTTRSFPKMILEPLGIEFIDMIDGSIEEL